MPNTSQSPDKTASGDIIAELRELGKNITETLRTTWESDERKRIQQEVEAGLTEMATTFKQTAHEFTQSPTGQNLKGDLEDLHQRIQSGEVEAKIRTDLLTALRTANAELKKALSKQQSGAGEGQDSSTHD